MVEVLLACYNGEKYLQEQLDSLIKQDYENLIITIRNDGSTDSTANILADYADKYPDKIKILNDTQNSGSACKSFIKLIGEATGDYVMFCDHDDVWMENKITTTIAAMQAAETVCPDLPLLVHTDLIPTDENLKPLSDSFTKSQRLFPEKNKLNDLLAQNSVTGCTVMINSELLSLLKTMPQYVLMHDWWAALTAAAFGKVVYLDVATMLYRQHGNNAVGAVSSSGAYVKDRKNTAKQRIISSYEQAMLLYDTYGYKLSENNKRLILEYADCKNKKKLSRIKTIFKYKTHKHGFIKALAQIFYC